MLERIKLEQLVDDTNLNAVLQALSEICGGRAASTPLFNPTSGESRKWNEAEGAVGLLATHPAVMAVSS